MAKRIKINLSIEVEESDLMNLMQKVIQLGGITTSIEQTEPNKVEDGKVFTSIRQIANHFQCSIPTAQKIKNAIPREQYSQTGRTFAIPESVLLKQNDLNKKII